MDRFEEESIVLSTVDYGEADRIVTLFTLGRGRLSAFAAGARKSKRRFPGALEPATHLKARLVERRGDTYRLDAADVVTSFHHLRSDLGRIARSLYALELCRELTRDHEAHPQLFNSLLEYLALLDRAQAGPTSLIAFELDTLARAGFRPQFAPCLHCHRETGPRPVFDPDVGGAICGNCAPQFPYAVPAEGRVVDALSRLQEGERTPFEAAIRSGARDLLNLFIEHHLGRRLKSVDFLNQVGVD
ncbi:MAG: DNA repair protein RecO [Archangiaceae bacterium]|nr:DNA repair protein RecO [Archangiaceae bacterium]